ncbi:hypothetical protein OMP38_03625 [Cohnella ginsengisoli]|uniref:Uncharacterized protein n=1 Tax=Cohnella ginsengisoli TaxID=425004 RepID=A0A9X4KDI7_9BACL|nr:hypothetical protein [Cohnella ginsengisoli]MDG0790043.1 hypothetical protein [Cohnella ginsengisoli]
MKNKVFNRLVATVLSLILVISSMSIGRTRVAHGADMPATLEVAQTQLSGGESINLSQTGNVDWLHMKGNGVNNVTQIKKSGFELRYV